MLGLPQIMARSAGRIERRQADYGEQLPISRSGRQAARLR